MLDPHFHDWLSLTIRWIHVITGIAWIGASFYFNWLEHNLNRTEGLREGIAGDLWAVHGGGFYYLEKYKVGPSKLPKTLHWFKWEAYFTWISGFALLIVVYYMNAEAFMVDPRVSEITPGGAVRIGLLSLLGGWLTYDLLCRSPIGRNNRLFGVVFFVLAAAYAYWLTRVLGPRAAYIHVGAMIGTIMAANVFTVIIPSQKAMVRAAERGEPMDANLGRRALQRSLHNNYLTLPVLFIMISNHYPVTFAHKWNWPILVALSIIGVSVRHYFNVRRRSHHAVWILPAAVAGMVALAFVTVPKSRESDHVKEQAATPTFVQVAAIFANRCNSCHSRTPTDDIFTVAPNGVTFDSPAEIKAKLAQIKARAVDTDSMPLANKTGMTDEERRILTLWVEAGGPIGEL